jgi:hypothetical protein
VSLMYFISEPGFINPSTSESLFNSWLTSVAHFLAWLSPKQWLYVVSYVVPLSSLFFYKLSCFSLCVWTLLSLVLVCWLWHCHLPIITYRVIAIWYWWEHACGHLICVGVPPVLHSWSSGTSNYLPHIVLFAVRIGFIIS